MSWVLIDIMLLTFFNHSCDPSVWILQVGLSPKWGTRVAWSGVICGFRGRGSYGSRDNKGRMFHIVYRVSFISLFVADRCLILVCLIMAGTPSCLYSLISVLVFCRQCRMNEGLSRIVHVTLNFAFTYVCCSRRVLYSSLLGI